MQQYVRMYGRFLRVYMKQQLEYRFAFFGDVIVNSMMFVALYAGFWVLFRQFEEIHGWTYYEVVFLYNINLVTYAISSLFFWAPMKSMENHVKSGEFDKFMTRPLHPLAYMICRQFQHTFLGHIIVAAVVFGICFNHLDIRWTFLQVLMFAATILGGVLIQAGIIITAGSSAFWVIRSNTIVDISIYAIRNYINYPISIYGKSIQILLTFILPYGFINYYPSTALLNKSTGGVSGWLAGIALLIGAVWFMLALLLFDRGMRRYESTGS